MRGLAQMATANDVQLKTLKDEVKRITTENEEISESWTIEGENVDTHDSAEKYRENLTKARGLKDQILLLEENDEIKAFMSEAAGSSSEEVALKAAIAAVRAAKESNSQVERKTLGRAFVDSEEYAAYRRKGGGNMDQAWEVNDVDLGSQWIGLYGNKDLYTMSPTANANVPFGFGPVQVDPGIVPLGQRTVRIRDLFPVQRTQASVIEFFRVSGFTNNASVVPERDTTVSPNVYGAKPHSNLSFLSATAPVRTIAHWETAHRNTLDDVDLLAGIVNNELLYGLRLAEDNQILNGTGNGEDLLGILNTPNIQGLSRAVNDNYADALRRAMTKAFLAYYEPTGVVLHPVDWEAIELLKATTGQYIIVTNVAVGATKQVWRLPVVDTPAIAQGTALVGSFGIGATLYDRMNANIRIAEQHSDLFIRNAVLVLAEERLALATKRPESFVKVSF
jgi:HK97 family phage major capsid protein